MYFHKGFKQVYFTSNLPQAIQEQGQLPRQISVASSHTGELVYYHLLHYKYQFDNAFHQRGKLESVLSINAHYANIITYLFVYKEIILEYRGLS